MLFLTGGCQGTGGSGASGESGPRFFGQHYPPSQSEPPIVESEGRKTAARTPAADLPDDGVDESSSATSRRRPRWLPGNEKPAQRRALPVSARNDLPSDDPAE
jgi:hypothetical protein